MAALLQCELHAALASTAPLESARLACLAEAAGCAQTCLAELLARREAALQQCEAWEAAVACRRIAAAQAEAGLRRQRDQLAGYLRLAEARHARAESAVKVLPVHPAPPGPATLADCPIQFTKE